MSDLRAAPVSRAAPSDRGFFGHPAGLLPLFFTEMWERFSFYGMRALLILFLTASAAEGGMAYDVKTSATIYGTYTMSGYLLSILGGFIADNFIGGRRAVLIGGIIIACGHASMAIPTAVNFFGGLVLVAIGTGLLKPNVSTMVGGLYAQGDARRDAGFSLFYMGINLGAFTAPFVTGFLAQSAVWKNVLARCGIDPRASWHWGFAAAGVGMTLGLVTYIFQGYRLGRVGERKTGPANPRRWRQLAVICVLSLVLVALLYESDRHVVIVYFLFALQVASLLTLAFNPNSNARKLAAVLVLFMAAEIFWAIFEQTGSSVSLFAEKYSDNRILGWGFPSSFWQSINSFWIILLAPIFAALWLRLGSRQPSSPLKFGLGLACVSASFVLMFGASGAAMSGRVSPLWLLGLFFLQTCGELLLSPVGLSTMTKLAPPALGGMVMGIWFLASAFGNKLAGVLAGGFQTSDPSLLRAFFGQQALAVAAAALVMIALVPWVKRLMGEVK